MRKRLAIALASLALLAGACGQAPWETSLKDVEGAQVQDPDYITLTNNVDKHPNVVFLCTEGLAFVTTTRPDFSALTRVPERDDFCEAQEGNGRTTDPGDGTQNP